MKKIKRLITILMIMLVTATPIYAQGINPDDEAVVLNSDLKSVVLNDSTSRVVATPRGSVISSSGVQISDEGGGILGVYAETLCHNKVKQIYISIYLDIWDEEREDWIVVDHYDYDWQDKDHPNLTYATVSFDLEGLTRGRTYRLRGLHAAKSYDSITEAMATRTAGIVLD